RLATTRHPTRPPLSRSPDCRALQRLRPAVPFGALGPRPDPRAPARAQLCPWPPRHPAPGPTTTTAPRGNDTGPAAEHLSRTPRSSPSRTGSVLELRRGPPFSRIEDASCPQLPLPLGVTRGTHLVDRQRHPFGELSGRQLPQERQGAITCPSLCTITPSPAPRAPSGCSKRSASTTSCSSSTSSQGNRSRPR